jgi:hypothetical protein
MPATCAYAQRVFALQNCRLRARVTKLLGGSQKFTFPAQLKRHSTEHGVNPYSCPEPGCSSSLRDGSTLRSHVIAHGRAYKCPVGT